ncbi:MAG: DUF3037 domain-containing protein [Lautropia sp.]
MRAGDSYDYAVIRVVPRVEREEFINVGIVLSCERAKFLQARIALNETRLRILDPGVDVDQVRRHLDAIVSICAGEAGSGPIGQLSLRARFHWLTARRSAIIQTSATHMGRCADLQATMDRLMRQMVLVPGDREPRAVSAARPCPPP